MVVIFKPPFIMNIRFSNVEPYWTFISKLIRGRIKSHIVTGVLKLCIRSRFSTLLIAQHSGGIQSFLLLTTLLKLEILVSNQYKLCSVGTWCWSVCCFGLLFLILQSQKVWTMQNIYHPKTEIYYFSWLRHQSR